MNKLVNNYLKPKSWENDGQFYVNLGVKYFFKITPFEIRRWLTGKGAKRIKNRKEMEKYYRETILAELTHLASFIFVLAVSLYIGFTGGLWMAITINLLNVLANLYPIFLMRYNRFRIGKRIYK
jgi:hypothetical protein